MNCFTHGERELERLHSYCASKLDSQSTAEVEQHVRECEACAVMLAEQMAAWSALDSFPAPEVSSDFDAKLYARIAAEQEAQPWWRRVWRPVLPMALAGAVLALALMIHTPDRSTVEVADKQTVDIEQIEQGLADLDMLATM